MFLWQLLLNGLIFFGFCSSITQSSNISPLINKMNDVNVNSNKFYQDRIPTPPIPVLEIVSDVFITVKWMILKNVNVTYELQQYCIDDLQWITVRSNITATRVYAYGISSPQLPNTECRFRVRARKNTIQSDYSDASEAFRTLSGPPTTPIHISIDSSSISDSSFRCSWDPPYRDGGSPILYYNLQYRLYYSNTPFLIQIYNSTQTLLRNLLPSKDYVIRMQAGNAFGLSKWTEYSYIIRTLPKKIHMLQSRKYDSIIPKSEERSSNNHSCANTIDKDYIHGIGNGGLSLQNGENGLITILPYSRNLGPIYSLKETFFFSGRNQIYKVPENPLEIFFIDIKLWGAGGGGGKYINSYGGGGGFTHAAIAVKPGELLNIFVGGGGTGFGKENHGGGFHGGQENKEEGTGGGGGASEVKRGEQVLIIAGGGGGGGTGDEINCFCDGGGFENIEVLNGNNCNETTNNSIEDYSKSCSLLGKFISGGKGADGYFNGGTGGIGAINISALIESNIIYEPLTAKIPSKPDIIGISPTSVTISWYKQKHLYGERPVSFSIEMSNGSVNEDFVYLLECNGTTFSATIKNLEPFSIYQFRVRSSSRLEIGIYSEEVVVSTKEQRKNRWEEIIPLPRLKQEISQKIPFEDQLKLNSPLVPSSRSGHSMVNMAKSIYIFGGYSIENDCDRGMITLCSRKEGFNNELWKVDPITYNWILLSPLNSPSPRNKHSAVVIAEKMLLFGGLNESQPLNDLWELDPGNISTYILPGMESNITILEGKQNNYSTITSISSDECIIGIRVQIKLFHSCSQQLEIRLFGPRKFVVDRKPKGQMVYLSEIELPIEQDPTLYWDKKASLKHGINQSGLYSTARSIPVILFKNHGEDDDCTMINNTISFNDQALNSILNAKTPLKGVYTPYEPLSAFYGIPALGVWTLAITDRRNDSLNGLLFNWSIEFDMKKCTPQYQWKKLDLITEGIKPSPRYQHSSIVVKNSMFLYGGMDSSGRVLRDLYRLDYIPYGINTWTKLSSIVSNTKSRFGSTMLLTPWQIISIHSIGSKNERYHSLNITIWKRNILSTIKTWHRIETAGNNIPVERYFSSALLLRDYNQEQEKQVKLFLVLYGGENDFGLLGDIWRNDMQEIIYSNPLDQIEAERYTICETRNQTTWQSACNSSTTNNSCTIDLILVHAWCLKQYQSISNI